MKRLAASAGVVPYKMAGAAQAATAVGIGSAAFSTAAAVHRWAGYVTKRIGLLWSALMIVAASPASASVVTYTNEAAWRAAAGTYALENFDGFTAGGQVSTLPSLGISLDKLGSSNVYPAIYDNNCGGSIKSAPKTLINFVYPCSVTPRGDLVFRPLSSIDILAMGYWNTGGDDTTKLEFLDSSGSVMGSITAIGLSFVGIVSTTAPSSMRISAVGGNSVFSIDDLQVSSQASAVSEPQTLVLALAGALFAVRLTRSEPRSGSRSYRACSRASRKKSVRMVLLTRQTGCRKQRTHFGG